MWIILKPGEHVRTADEVYFHDEQKWLPIRTRALNTVVKAPSIVRRNLTGWEAVKYALETEVLGNDKEGCETTKLFWDCECSPEDRVDAEMKYDHINPAGYDFCCHCSAGKSESPDSRKAEVIMKIIEEGHEED